MYDKSIKIAAATAMLAGLGYGIYNAQSRELATDRAARDRVSRSPKIQVAAPADGIDKCFYMEHVDHTDVLRAYFRKAAKEGRNMLVMSDLDNDGFGCGQKGKKVE